MPLSRLPGQCEGDLLREPVAVAGPRRQTAGSTFVHDGRIVAVGGEGTGRQVIASASAYDPATNTWSNLTSLPAARLSGVGGSFVARMIFTGGVGKFGTTFGYAVDTWIGELVERNSRPGRSEAKER